MYNFKFVTNTKNMKKLFLFTLSMFIVIGFFISITSPFHESNIVFAKSDMKNKTPMRAIVIDDFGSFDRSGVKTMLSIEAPITCAIMPNLEFSTEDMENAIKSKKEVILHMPMQSHVNLPANWYGPVYIYNNDTPLIATEKLEKCLKSIPEAKGFNIHIGSGVSQNETLMKAIIDYAKENNLYFLDSRTHMGTICEKVAKEENVVYLGRDEFLEPDHNKSYDGVKNHLLIGRDKALEKGYAIVIGHVGSHGGENTAKAIKDTIKEIEDSGVKIVSLSEIYNFLNAMNTNNS